MIGRIEGRLLEKNPPGILVDANGVGYEIDVPMSTFYQLPSISERVTLLTHLIVREDAQDFRRRCPHSPVGAFRVIGLRACANDHVAGKRTLDACAGYRQENRRASVA